ncbi:MAG TPA: hypothetical protein VEI52_24580 [Terriglobales bacterium]|nr:hypothetical protein [Terriglobales bacterium]
MRAAERATPVAAVIAALSTLACCLPLGFLGALGLAGASLWLQAARPWLLASAGVLLVLGFIQLYVRRTQCPRRSPLSVAMFWVAAVIVLLVVLFPQLIASLIAGWDAMVNIKHVLWLAGIIATLLILWYFWGSQRTPPGQPPLTSLSESNIARFRSDFDGASGKVRLVLLLSPT